MIERKYNVVQGERKAVVEARNGLYAAVAGLEKCGYRVAQNKRGRGQKAEVAEDGGKVYTVKSLWKKAGFTVSAEDGFHAAEKAMEKIGAKVTAAGLRGRPKGSKNKPKAQPVETVVTPAATAAVAEKVNDTTPETQG
jgi:hypothetical protein